MECTNEQENDFESGETNLILEETSSGSQIVPDFPTRTQSVRQSELYLQIFSASIKQA